MYKSIKTREIQPVPVPGEYFRSLLCLCACAGTVQVSTYTGIAVIAVEMLLHKQRSGFEKKICTFYFIFFGSWSW